MRAKGCKKECNSSERAERLSDGQDSSQAADDLGPLEAVFRWIERKRLQAPAVAVLEMHRPLAPLAWTLATLAGPAVAPFVGHDYYERIKALRDPAMLDRLFERLEASRRQDKKERDR
jgi:hypothetical protein